MFSYTPLHQVWEISSVSFRFGMTFRMLTIRFLYIDLFMIIPIAVASKFDLPF